MTNINSVFSTAQNIAVTKESLLAEEKLITYDKLPISCIPLHEFKKIYTDFIDEKKKNEQENVNNAEARFKRRQELADDAIKILKDTGWPTEYIDVAVMQYIYFTNDRVVAHWQWAFLMNVAIPYLKGSKYAPDEITRNLMWPSNAIKEEFLADKMIHWKGVTTKLRHMSKAGDPRILHVDSGNSTPDFYAYLVVDDTKTSVQNVYNNTIDFKTAIVSQYKNLEDLQEDVRKHKIKAPHNAKFLLVHLEATDEMYLIELDTAETELQEQFKDHPAFIHSTVAKKVPNFLEQLMNFNY